MLRSFLLALFAVACCLTAARAQEVSIPDPGLNAVVRDTLSKAGGPITVQDMLSLTFLSACCRDIHSLEGLETARNLNILDLDSNSLTNFVFPSTWTNLTVLDLFLNNLTNFVLPSGFPKLTIIDVGFNALSECLIPSGLTNLETLFVEGNRLTNFALPAGLTHLKQLDVSDNGLTSLTLPPDMAGLTSLFVNGNPLMTLVLPEPLAATNLAQVVASLQNGGVSVFTYPLEIQLFRPRLLVGAFQFGIAGPPGVFHILGSSDLATWTEIGVTTNTLGSVSFVDGIANLFQQRFYRVLFQAH